MLTSINPHLVKRLLFAAWDYVNVWKSMSLIVFHLPGSQEFPSSECCGRAWSFSSATSCWRMPSHRNQLSKQRCCRSALRSPPRPWRLKRPSSNCKTLNRLTLNQNCATQDGSLEWNASYFTDQNPTLYFKQEKNMILILNQRSWRFFPVKVLSMVDHKCAFLV